MDINMVKEAVLGNMEALVKEDAKKAFVKWLQEKALPAVTEIADKFRKDYRIVKGEILGVEMAIFCLYREGVLL